MIASPERSQPGSRVLFSKETPDFFLNCHVPSNKSEDPRKRHINLRMKMPLWHICVRYKETGGYRKIKDMETKCPFSNAKPILSFFEHTASLFQCRILQHTTPSKQDNRPQSGDDDTTEILEMRRALCPSLYPSVYTAPVRSLSWNLSLSRTGTVTRSVIYASCCP